MEPEGGAGDGVGWGGVGSIGEGRQAVDFAYKEESRKCIEEPPLPAVCEEDLFQCRGENVTE